MITFSQLGRYGRFANQLFQIAGTIGLATKHGYAYAFPKWINHDHKDRFGSSEDVDIQKYFVNPLPTTDVSLPDFPVSWGYHPDLKIRDGISLSGHMQSEKYFAHCKDLIRHYFTMKDEKGIEDAVAIHVRRGDYDNAYHPRIDAEYYGQAIKHFPDNAKLLLFTDDYEAGLAIFREIGVVDRILLAPEKADYLYHFRTMKQCRHFITSNSSFSLIASMLSPAKDKKIICPANWFGPAWGQMPETKDLYPENAIVI